MRAVTSALLEQHGFAHGFSLRHTGVSRSPWDSLNLASTVGDDPAAVEENRRLFAAEIGYLAPHLFEVSQVHGAEVRVLTAADDPARVRAEDADALLSAVPATPIAVRVADCAPILLADPDTGAVGAVHAGWRGCVAEIVPRAVSLLAEHTGTKPARFVAAIGPHIRQAAFEVGEEVAEELERAAPSLDVVDRSGAKPHVDLGAIVRAQLVRAGLPSAHVEDVGGCTFAEADRFHSFRRDGRRSGRHLAVIVARGTRG